MAKDQRVLVLGEDVGKDGGVFRATEGLFDLYGGDRVVDMPLGESGFIGASIGLAVMGMRPVVEIQFDGFSYSTFEQLICHASKLRNRSRGRYTVPMVMRFPYGGGIRALEHHSESPEAYFAHVPGLKVVVPSTPYDAKGLMISCIRDNNPVVFMEPKKIYRSFREEVPDAEYSVPLGKAKVTREGSDVTVVSWGAMAKLATDTANAMTEAKEADVEVIDLRTISPMDEETIVKSVEKTGRCIVLHEATKTGGVGAEVAARVQQKAFDHLEAPIARVTGWDTPYPGFKLENNYIPNASRLRKAILESKNY